MGAVGHVTVESIMSIASMPVNAKIAIDVRPVDPAIGPRLGAKPECEGLQADSSGVHTKSRPFAVSSSSMSIIAMAMA